MVNRSLRALFAGMLAAGLMTLPVAAQQPSADGSSLGVQGLTDDEANGIKSLIEAWTKDLQSGDYAAWAKYWARDAVLAPPDHERIVGEAGIADYVRKNFGSSTGFSFDDWSIAGRDDLAVVTNTLTWQGNGGDATYNQIIVLRRDGSDWRVQSVIFNSPS